MYRTRITAKLLVGVALTATAVSGCVSVAPPQDVVAPPPGTSGPVQDVAPQGVQPPVRDSLGALPDTAASASASSRGAATPDSGRNEPPAPRQRERTVPPQQAPRQEPRIPPDILPTVTGHPVTGKDVCSLGRGYGRWPADSPQSRICDEAYGR